LACGGAVAADVLHGRGRATCCQAILSPGNARKLQ
jgi:hypothetical protein